MADRGKYYQPGKNATEVRFRHAPKFKPAAWRESIGQTKSPGQVAAPDRPLKTLLDRTQRASAAHLGGKRRLRWNARHIDFCVFLLRLLCFFCFLPKPLCYLGHSARPSTNHYGSVDLSVQQRKGGHHFKRTRVGYFSDTIDGPKAGSFK